LDNKENKKNQNLDENDDDNDDEELTPAPELPNFAELSEFALSFYKSGGIVPDMAEIEAEKKREEAEKQAELLKEQEKEQRIKEVKRRLSSSSQFNFDGDEKLDEVEVVESNSLRVPQKTELKIDNTKQSDDEQDDDNDDNDKHDDNDEQDDFGEIPGISLVVPKNDAESRAETAEIEQELMDEWNTCAACSEQPENIDDAYTLEACGHRVCSNCVVKATLLAENRPDVECPADGCVASVRNRVLRLLLPSEQFEKRLNRELELALESDTAHRFVRCPGVGCGFVCEAAEIEEDEKSSLRSSKSKKKSKRDKKSKKKSKHVDDDDDDDDNDDNDAQLRKHSSRKFDVTKPNPTRKEVSSFRQLHRFRCRKCFIDFCDVCRVTPFHDQFTCASLAAYEKAPKCRYCNERVTGVEGDANSIVVCNAAECQAKKVVACDTIHKCGHPCGGLRFEAKHLPCLNENCVDGGQLSDDFCNICWVDELGAAPSIQLNCGHVFHFNCVKQRIDSRWGGARISFAFAGCPLCHKTMEHPALLRMQRKVTVLRESIERLAAQRLEYENLSKHKDIVDENGRFYKDPLGFAMNRFAYYECYECKSPYFGGQAQCAGGPGEDQDGHYNPKLLVCQPCQKGGNGADAMGGVIDCETHGKDYIEFKCKFCCSIANWYCWGTTHMCDDCHKTQANAFVGTKMTRRPLSDFPRHWSFKVEMGNIASKWPKNISQCPLGIERHPRNGESDYSLGCAMCRQTAQARF